VDDGGYPVMYDCSLENHHGRGINILMLDGSVRWDPGAAWLRQFASQHPEFSIALPD
jgi:prepilin-type processing-associated H-X9-DG protein